MAVGLYYNQSDGPLTVESVALLHPRNLALRGTVVYKMARYSDPLPVVVAWPAEGYGVPAAEWASASPFPER
jgi:hypothetical protein